MHETVVSDLPHSRLPEWGRLPLEKYLEKNIDSGEAFYIWFHTHPAYFDPWFLLLESQPELIKTCVINNDRYDKIINSLVSKPREENYGSLSIYLPGLNKNKFNQRDLLQELLAYQVLEIFTPATSVKIDFNKKIRSEYSVNLYLHNFDYNTEVAVFSFYNQRDFIITPYIREEN